MGAVHALVRLIGCVPVRAACYGDGESHDALEGAYAALAGVLGGTRDAISATVQQPDGPTLLDRLLESDEADTVTVAFTREQLAALVGENARRDAIGFTSRMVAHCESLTLEPGRSRAIAYWSALRDAFLVLKRAKEESDRASA